MLGIPFPRHLKCTKTKFISLNCKFMVILLIKKRQGSFMVSATLTQE